MMAKYANPKDSLQSKGFSQGVPWTFGSDWERYSFEVLIKKLFLHLLEFKRQNFDHKLKITLVPNASSKSLERKSDTPDL